MTTQLATQLAAPRTRHAGRRSASIFLFATVAAAIGLVAGCSSAPVTAPPPPPPQRTTPTAVASVAAVLPVPRGLDYNENDFIESDRNRDPFRPFSAPVEGPKQLQNQREVKLAQYSVDELKLEGIIHGGDGSSAMFVDPTGKGHFLRRLDYLCRPDVVHVGGANGTEYQLNWRVDEIRDGDVVLIRKDPAYPAVPPATRIIPLHPDQDKENQDISGRPG